MRLSARLEERARRRMLSAAGVAFEMVEARARRGRGQGGLLAPDCGRATSPTRWPG